MTVSAEGGGGKAKSPNGNSRQRVQGRLRCAPATRGELGWGRESQRGERCGQDSSVETVENPAGHGPAAQREDATSAPA